MMVVEAAPGTSTPVSDFICRRIAQTVDRHRVVVWYDEDRAFGGLLDRWKRSDWLVVSAAASTLRARREADAAYLDLDAPEAATGGRRSLLIYAAGEREPGQYEVSPHEKGRALGATGVRYATLHRGAAKGTLFCRSKVALPTPFYTLGGPSHFTSAGAVPASYSLQKTTTGQGTCPVRQVRPNN